MSGKRYEGEGDLPDDEGMLCHHTECRRDLWRKTIMLTDPGKVHDFLGLRRRYDRMAFFTTPAEKRKIVEIDPDWYNLLSRVCSGDMHDPYAFLRHFYEGEADVGDVTDDYRRAVLKLLRTWPHLGILQARQMLSRVAKELEQLWWPDPKAEKRRRRRWDAGILRKSVDMLKAGYREEGVKSPRDTALDTVAKQYGFASGKALGKFIQPNRVHRKTRRKPRG